MRRVSVRIGGRRRRADAERDGGAALRSAVQAPRPDEAASTPAAPLCHAPTTSIYLDPRGFVRACAANQEHVLGNVADGSLHDLWRGEAADRLRAAVAEGRFDLGCRECGRQVAEGAPALAYARLFDRFAGASSGWPAQMEFALGNRCNLECVMCNGDLSSGIRRHRDLLPPLPPVYGERFFDDLPQFLRHLQHAKFLGGEPFLVPEHHRVWDLMIEEGLEVACHVTTNGTIWNERVERILDALPVSISVSLDGVRPETIARIRRGAAPELVLGHVERFLASTRERGTSLTLTYSLMTLNWQEFDDFLRYADGLDVDVWVNNVLSPARYSLVRLPPAQLAEVVAALDRRDVAVRSSLGRNRGVWTDQLHKLRLRLAALSDPAGASDRLAVGLSRLSDGERQTPATAENVDAWQRTLQGWADPGLMADLSLDLDDVAVKANLAGFLGRPIDPVGLGIDELVTAMQSQLGRWIGDQGGEAAAPGVPERRGVLETHEGATEIRSVSMPILGADGEVCGIRWMLAARAR